MPTKIGNLLDMTLKELEKILYFEAYVVTSSEEEALAAGTLLNEEKYRALLEEHGDKFTVGIGAEAIRDLLKAIDLVELSRNNFV